MEQPSLHSAFRIPHSTFELVFATRNQRNAKAELNRRSQVCEVLTGTGIRVAKVFPSAPNPASGHYFGLCETSADRPGSLGKLVEHQGSAPYLPVCKTGVPTGHNLHLLQP